MSNKDQKANDKALLITNLLETWPHGDFKKTGIKDLLWLAEIAAIRESLGKKAMTEVLAEYRKTYEDSKTPSGRASKRCGDKLSILLTGLDGTQAIKLAEMVLALEEGFLMAKYEGLNEGQRRMNAGNRIRGGLKREDITIEEVEKMAKAA